MKTSRTRVNTFLLGALISSFVIVSCQKNGLLSSDTEASAKSSTIFVAEPGGTTLPDCNDHCISSEGPYVEKTNSITQNWGRTNDPNSKTVSYVVYNTATSFVVKVTFVHSGGNSSNTVSVTALGATKSVPTLASGSTATFSFDLPAGWTKCTNVAFSVYQEGQSSPVNIADTYSLYGVCIGCITEFSGEAISCGTQREAVFHFNSKDAVTGLKIQGGLTNFTGNDAIVEVSDPSLTVTQWTPGGSSNRIIKIEGNAAACTPITITVKWNSSNSGGIITGSWSATNSSGTALVDPAGGLSCGN